MKKIKLIQCISLIVMTLTIIGVSGCKKNNDYKNLLGNWVSKDLIDTLDFTSDTSFNKMYSGSPDYFKYELSKDSITIQYSGKLFLYVFPTTHHFQRNDEELTIDFSNGCYGFRKQIINFTRK
jgi:hypothetical protein